MSIATLYVDAAVQTHPDVPNFEARLGLRATVVDDPAVVYQTVSAAADPILAAKQVLFLTRNRGAFLKKCPGTKTYTCCDYLILHIGTFCTMDCSYCILQSYFHPPVLQFFLNQADLLRELRDHFSTRQISRIGTGEFTDSLIWEPWTNISKELVLRFSRQRHAVLELKTKTSNIHQLSTLEHNRKTILAWSLNTEAIIDSEERHTASLPERLSAAAKSEEWGYPIAFHFDPMVIYDGCEADYVKIVDQIFSTVSSENIVWISLGAFRFIPALKPLIQNRFPQSKIPYGEFISGKDGKMRYFQPLRIHLFKRVISRIREWAPEVLVYLCMEDDTTWQRSMGFTPAEKGGLAAMLDGEAVRVCGLKL